MALLAAMVFGVHPIHTEVVNSIFNRSGLLVSLGVIGGLWWFLRTLESSPRKAWGGLALVYLLVLFCKESGVILPVLAVVMLWLFTPGDWRVKLRKSIPVLWLLIPLGIYLGLRANALDVPSAPQTTGTPEIIQIPSTRDLSKYFDWDRLLAANRIWFESLKLLVWPHPLQIHHTGFSVNKWMALVLQLTLVSLAIVGFRQKRYGLMAGLAFFYIAILPATWFMKGHPTLAERFIYLPSVGLIIVLAFGLQWLVQRFNLRMATAPVLIALVVLTPVTLVRNAEWASDVLLYESSYRRGNQDGKILQMLVGAHLGKKNYSRAAKICDRHADQLRKKEKFSGRCGRVYSQVGRFDDAEQAFLFAIKDPKTKALNHQELASMYLHLGRRSDAKKHFELAVVTEQNPAFREFRKAYMLLKLYPNDRANLLEAKMFLEQSIQLQPETNQAHQLLNQISRVLDEN
jgi:tetratricopeptide (TPR) repeat protein